MNLLPLKRSLLSIGLILALTETAALADLSFSEIPSARSVEESQQLFDARADIVIDFYLEQPVAAFQDERPIDFSAPSVARLLRGRKINEVLNSLLDPRARPYALVGSDFHALGALCRRKGDYDFMLASLIPVAHLLSKREDAASRAAFLKVRDELLNTHGNRVKTHVHFGLCGSRPETENHVLMTESSRLLTNELLFDREVAAGRNPSHWDNEKNGMNVWMLQHLARFLRDDFSELNSRPYQGYSALALGNLATYARDPRIKQLAEMVLDYLAAKYASHSLDLRRSVPFRRQRRHWYQEDLLRADAESSRYAILAGHFPPGNDGIRRPSYGAQFMMNAAVQSYRIDPLILARMVEPNPTPWLQRFRTRTPEVYFRSPNFLISAGGRYENWWDLGTGENDVWARPTTILPRGGATAQSILVRFEGNRNFKRRFNLCVAPRFACGVNGVLPSNAGELERRSVGEFTFLRFSDFYLSAYLKDCRTGGCSHVGSNFGWMEARESNELTFDEFIAKTISLNLFQSGTALRPQTVYLSDGTEVTYLALPNDSFHSGVLRYGRRLQPVDSAQWPLAEGHVIQASGDGLVRIHHPTLPESLELDARNPLAPSRRKISRVVQ